MSAAVLPTRRPAAAPTPRPLPPALPASAPRSGFTIRVPQPGANTLVCPGCRRAVGLASLRWLPGHLRVGCIACVNAEEVAR